MKKPNRMKALLTVEKLSQEMKEGFYI